MSINFHSGLEITLLKNPGYPRSREPWFWNYVTLSRDFSQKKILVFFLSY